MNGCCEVAEEAFWITSHAIICITPS